jgi:hydrogenase-4 component E
MTALILFGILVSTAMMAIAKRAPALVRGFRGQSFFLFCATLAAAFKVGHSDFFVVAGLVLCLKVIFVPHLLSHMIKRIKASEDLGLFVNAQLSLLWLLGFMYLSWRFARMVIPDASGLPVILFAVSFSVALTGMFLMVSRMTALAQIVGILVMENGLFLLATSVAGGMPFFVEIAVFLDVFVSVIILGIFVYRISKLFTHIDVNKLSRLRG